MITGERFLEVAGKLAARPTASEAEQRSAISRAYYGAFHLARTFLRSLQIAVEERNHDFVKNCLISCGHPEMRSVGQDLGDLRAERNRADYDIDREFVRKGIDAQAFTRDCVESAMQIATVISKCQDDSVKLQIKKGVDEFLVRQGKRRLISDAGDAPSAK